MAESIEPRAITEFHGVYTAGSPLKRPSNSAQVCENFRVMPGQWLRLRGGRKARFNIETGYVQKLHSFRPLDRPGSTYNLCQVRNAGGSRWHWFSSSDFALDPFGILAIDQTNDGGYTLNNPGASANVGDWPVFYNGAGVRGATSRPGLSSYVDGVIRYFGLDAYAPGGRPSATFTVGAGLNSIGVDGRIKLYVGLYSPKLEHYSNGIYAGAVSAPVDATDYTSGVISINDLTQLTFAYNNVTEQTELKYCFYATIEGGQTPYLIMNAALNGPLVVAAGTSSASLAIASGTTNGWVLDLTKEMPTENYPPRRMRHISYVNRRTYGCLLPATPTGTNNVADPLERPTDYAASGRETAGMVWSMVAGDIQDRSLLGDPAQCWPPRNFIATPSGDAPLWHGAAPDEQSVLVITPTATFLLTDLINGVHTWTPISMKVGISEPKTVVQTNYGICWLDQNNQLVILRAGSKQVEILSSTYQYLLRGTPKCADHIYDSLNLIDRYQVWFADGKSVIHDFAVGEAYSLTGQPFVTAGTLRDENNRQHHVVANAGFYTHEAQAEDGLIPTSDETFTGVGQAKTLTYFSGRIRFNWDALGSLTTRKEFPFFDLCVDQQAALSVKWWADFKQPTDLNKLDVSIVPLSSTASVFSKRVKLQSQKPVSWKIEITLTGHAGRATYDQLEEYGDAAQNFYGSILALTETVSPGRSRL